MIQDITKIILIIFNLPQLIDPNIATDCSNLYNRWSATQSRPSKYEILPHPTPIISSFIFKLLLFPPSPPTVASPPTRASDRMTEPTGWARFFGHSEEIILQPTVPATKQKIISSQTFGNYHDSLPSISHIEKIIFSLQYIYRSKSGLQAPCRTTVLDYQIDPLFIQKFTKFFIFAISCFTKQILLNRGSYIQARIISVNHNI